MRSNIRQEKIPQTRVGFIFISALVCLMAGACADRPFTTPQISRAEKIAYKDGIGRRVELPRHPIRIISLAPNITEIIYSLGAQDRLVGDTTLCNWPEDAKRKPKIGDLLNPNDEVILAAKPDLVIASTAGNDQGAVLKLIKLGLPVYVAAPRNVERIFQTIEDIGRITDCAEKGLQLVAKMKERLGKVTEKLAGLPPVRAFFITWFDPLLAPGQTTFENDVLHLAGVVSITADIPEFYPRYSLEQLLVKDPDAILTVPHSGDPIPDLKKTRGWKNLRAVKENRVYFLGEFLQHPSPLFVDGIEELARKLHPERFQ
jgi:iron complex transport system substrate-binding protein